MVVNLGLRLREGGGGDRIGGVVLILNFSYKLHFTIKDHTTNEEVLTFY